VWLVQTIVGLVAAGVGVALVPETARPLQRAGVAFRPLRPKARELELIAAWRRGAVGPVLAGFLAGF
jgi:DNA-binding transcriptional LysR family regulator